MPTPLEFLRKGLLQKNWAYISQGYALLSGEKIAVEIPKFEAAAKALESVLSHLEAAAAEAKLALNGPGEDFDPADVVAAPARPKKKRPQNTTPAKKATKKRAPKPDPVEDEDQEEEGEEEDDEWAEFRTELPGSKGFETALAKENKWEDEGAEEDENLRLNQLMCGKLKPQKRTRGKIKYVDRSCERCHKKFRLHSDFRPRHLEKGADATTFVCDGCLPKPEGRPS